MSKNLNLVDLTSPNVQGSYGHDYINLLIEPGLYKLPFKDYSKGELNSIAHVEVEVVYVNSSTNDRMQVIIVKKDNQYQDFYYNGAEKCFKFLSEDNDTIENWWKEEDIKSEVPRFLLGTFMGIDGRLGL